MVDIGSSLGGFREMGRAKMIFSWISPNNKKYKRITTLFKRENVILVQTAFLIDAVIQAQKFPSSLKVHRFTSYFNDQKCLLKLAVLRLIGPKILEGKSGAYLAKIVVDSHENQLSLDKMLVGATTEHFLRMLSPHNARRKRIAMKNFLVAVSS